MKTSEIEKFIKKKYGNSSDLVFRKIKIGSKEVMYVYLESVSSDDKISDFLMKNLSSYYKNGKNIFKSLFNTLENSIYNSNLKIETKMDDILLKLSAGFTIIFVDKDEKAISIETRKELDHGITDSTSETIIRGSKDSFNENQSTNLGLIRKRIKDSSLWFKDLNVGRKTKTKITIAYIDGITNKKIVDEIYKQIKKIDVDGIMDSGYVRDFILGENKTSFPKMKSTERPDVACSALLEGKVVILVENSPFVLITPSIMTDFLHTPEDYNQKTSNINFTRILRFLALILTLLTPAFYVAVTTFNQEMIPNELLISLAIQQDGVPFPTAFEVIMMMITFEILRESDIRIASAMGAAVSIVGALVLGEAAVSAGIVSPIVIIVVAITSICGLLFTDIDFVNAIRVWRLIFILFATVAGMVGIFIGMIFFITKLAAIETNDIPYLVPFAPLFTRDLKDSIIRFPMNKMKRRPSYLTNNTTKVGENIE